MATDESPALVLLHGFTNTGSSWWPVVEALGQRYWAIAPDIRGHGPDARRPVTLELVLEDLEALTPERHTLAGYSMGGRIALHAALALPDRITRLVLISASPGIADPIERTARREADDRLANEIDTMEIAAFAEMWAQTRVLAGVPPQVAAKAYEDRIRSSSHGLAAALRGLGTGALPSLWHRLRELPMPVDLIVGERDEKFRVLAEEMAAAIPHADIHVISGAGHAVHLERPEAVAELLLGV